MTVKRKGVATAGRGVQDLLKQEEKYSFREQRNVEKDRQACLVW